jgi:hypothetical protein
MGDKAPVPSLSKQLLRDVKILAITRFFKAWFALAVLRRLCVRGQEKKE